MRIQAVQDKSEIPDIAQYVKVMLKRFYLNGHTIRFHPHTQKLEPL